MFAATSSQTATFVIYNYFRQGWLAARLQKGLEEVFGESNPLVLTLPYRKVIDPDKATFGDFTIFFAGATERFAKHLLRQPDYWLRNDQPPGPESPNGFQEARTVKAGLQALVPSRQMHLTGNILGWRA